MKAGPEGMEIVFDPLPNEAMSRMMLDHILAVNFARTGQSDWHPVNFFLRNERGEWLGGVTG